MNKKQKPTRYRYIQGDTSDVVSDDLLRDCFQFCDQAVKDKLEVFIVGGQKRVEFKQFEVKVEKC